MQVELSRSLSDAAVVKAALRVDVDFRSRTGILAAVHLRGDPSQKLSCLTAHASKLGGEIQCDWMRMQVHEEREESPQRCIALPRGLAQCRNSSISSGEESCTMSNTASSRRILCFAILVEHKLALNAERGIIDRPQRLAYHAHKVRSEDPARALHLAPLQPHSPAGRLYATSSRAIRIWSPQNLHALCPNSGTARVSIDDPCPSE